MKLSIGHIKLLEDFNRGKFWGIAVRRIYPHPIYEPCVWWIFDDSIKLGLIALDKNENAFITPAGIAALEEAERNGMA